MKGAPKKIYLVKDENTDKPMDYWYTATTDDSKVEYIRTDAFIEKVCDLLDRMIVDVTYNECDGSLTEHYDKHEFIEEFKECLRNK